MTPGNELKLARERLNLSREEISLRTKIQVRKIEALEDDAFDQLPAGVYLDGIAAAYAREVGLDAETFIRRLRTHVAPLPQETLQRIVAARQSAEQRSHEPRLSVAHSMLAFAAVGVVLTIAGIGVRLYPGAFATDSRAGTVPGALSRREPAARPAENGFQVREEQGTTGSEPVADPAGLPPVADAAPPETSVVVEQGQPDALDVRTAVETHASVPASVGRPKPTTARIERPDIRQREAPPVSAGQTAFRSLATASATPSTPMPALSSLTGTWTLETEVESSSLRAFKGLRLGYHLELRQNGDRIEGTGRKVTENGVVLSGARRTAITVHGTWDEGRMRLTFGEDGANRPTRGTFDLVIDEKGALRGVFASEAARSAGAVAGRRL